MSSSGGGLPNTSVKVALRIKPITNEDVAKLPSRFQRQVITTSPYAPNQVIVEAEKHSVFQFDLVFGPESTQQEIYDDVAVENLIEKFLEGFNVTILAYGQTSSGKTFTMGTADNDSTPSDQKGIIPRAMSTLFSLMNTKQYKSRKFTMNVSFIEIYNEDLIDLLGEGGGDTRPHVMIREDSRGNIYWSGLQEMRVNNVEEVMGYLRRGSQNRQVGATDMNSQSSRSHAIFSVTMSHQKFVGRGASPTPLVRSQSQPSRSCFSPENCDDGEWTTISSKFHFVDLAGSERLKRTAASGDRAKEGISINSGLLALGNVISILGDPNKAKHKTHIPYRDSKLTRLLQDSLGGNAQTLMIACVSPVELNLNETLNTLKYAQRARNIKNTATINQEETSWNDLSHLQNLVLKLRAEVSTLKSALTVAEANAANNNESTPSVTNGTTTSSTVNGQTAHNLLKLPTSGIKNPSSGISGLKSPTPAITGRKTPTPMSSGIPRTPGIPGRNTSTPGTSGRTTPSLGSGREATSMLRRPSNNSTSEDAQDTHGHLETSEQQFLQLQKSYAELSMKYGKMSAELAKHQDINENAGRNFISLAEPIIEEYEKSVSTLESNLAATQAALSHAELMLEEHEEKLAKSQKTTNYYKEIESSLRNDIEKLKSKLEEREIQDELIKKREAQLDELKIKHQRSLDQIQELQSKLTDVNQQVSDLGSKLSILQDNHNKKLSNLADSESKYRASLLLIQDLQDQLEESQRRHSGIIEELHSISSTPMTPMSSYPESRNEDLLPPKPIVPFVTSRPPLHRKAKSMSSVETGGAGMTDSAHAAIIEKLQFELELFESFHEDKSQSLDAVKRELNRLEQHHQETLLVVDELREEIKRRDALALLHVNMVINSSEKETNSTKNDRIDELIVVNRLRKEIEELKERQRQTMQNILEREKDNKLRSEEARKLQLSIWQLREELSFAIEEQKYANDTEKTPSSRESIVSKLLSRIRESEEQLAVMRGDVQHVGDFLHDSNDSCDAEMIELRRQAEKLQADIQTKSQAIAIFLLPEELLGSEETHIRTVNDNIINHITKNGLSDTTDNDYLEKASSDKLGLLPRHFTNQTQDTLDVIQSKLSTVQGSKGDLMSLLQPHFETLKAEFRRKDKLIESLKHDLVDKGMLHQKLRESEAEIFVLLQRLNATKKQESPDQVSQLEDISKDTGKSLKESEKGYHNNSEKEAFVLERLRNLDAEESKIQKELERIITQELSEHDQLNCAKKPAQLISMKSSNGNEKLIVEQLRTQLNDVKEAKKTIIHEWESMELTFRAQARLVITLESEMQTLTDALNVAKEGHAEALKKSENLQAQVKTLENQLTEVEKERGEYARRVNDLLQTMESHEIQKKDLVSSLERKVSDLDSQIHDLKEALKNSSDTLNEKEQLSSAKDSHIKELQSSIQKVKDEFKAIEVAKSAESERAREFQSNIVFLESKIVDLEARLRANPSPEDLETAQQSAAKNLVLVKEMETKLEEANHQNAAEIATIRETISKLTTELEEKRIAENAQKQLVKELEGVLSEREGKLKEVNKQLGQVKESEQRQVEQIQSLEVQLQILQKSRDEEVMKLEEANAEIENLKEQYMCLHDDTLIPVQNLENLEKIMSNDLKIQLEQCQQTIMELEGKMVQLENEKGEQCKIKLELEDHHNNLQQEHKKLKEDLNSTAERLAEIENLSHEQQKRIMELKVSLEEEAKKQENYSNDMHKMTAEIEERENEKSRVIASLEESLSENQKLLKESKRQLHGIKQENAELDKQVFTLKIQLDQATEQYRHASLSVQEVLYSC